MSGSESYEAVIGLEIHVQLATRTKMFCRCANRYGDEPNTNVCPICLAHPGMLPEPNAEAVRQTLRVGLALGCRVPEHAKFDRKNYFYPDSPKGYQISQYDEPLCAEGRFHMPGDDGGIDVRIVRAHLEEDAAKTIHHGGEAGRIAGSAGSVVDFNRAGTPLLEIVTAPDLHSGRDARRFLTLLRATIVAIGASDCDMEKGSLRCDANVSVRPAGSAELGVKCELKNMNSFRFLERGVNAEVARQIALLDAGERIVQATLHYDPARDALTVLRTKEEADDYRYFPEPDLAPLAPARALLDELAASLPELPLPRMERLRTTYGISAATAENLTLAPALGDYFEELAHRSADARAAANWVTGEFAAHLKATGLAAGASPVTPERLAVLVRLVAEGTVSSTSAKHVFAALAERPDANAEALVDELGLVRIGDADVLAGAVAEVLAAHPGEVAAYRGGKTQLIGFFTGQVMRASRGRADPSLVQELLRERLGAE